MCVERGGGGDVCRERRGRYGEIGEEEEIEEKGGEKD